MLAESRQRTCVLDSKGKLASMSIGGITPWSFAYDTRGRLTTVTQGTRIATFAYDALNRLTSITDPLSRTVQFGYDNADRVTQQTLPDGRVIGFAYDKNGNLTAVTPPSRPAHLFAYTPVDLTQTYTPPSVSNGGATQYAYNKDRQLTSITRPDGKAVTLGYDPAGRLGTLTIARGAYTFSYDSSGRLGSITAPSGDSIGYQYDGPLPIHTQWNGTVSGAIDWTYDNDLALSSEAVHCATATNSACQPVSFSYDQDKLLTGAGAESIARDPQSGLVTNTAAGSASDAWTYNAFGEPASYTASWSATPLMSEQWTWDDAGRITGKSETIGGVTSVYTYGYDTAGRLTTVTTNGTVTANYTYDENSNRLTKNSEVGTYDAQDRMLTYNGASYSYTANGELQSKTDATGTTTYSYDELGNLLSVTKPDGTLIEYVIDAQNRRVGKKVNGTLVMELVYSDGLRPAAEIDPNGNVMERFIYGSRTNVPDLIVKGDVTYRVISDHLGSPRLVVNTADGTIAERVDYDEFGIVTNDTAPGFQPFGFAGGLYDQDTNLVRFGVRDYDPATGRWTTKDEALFAGSDPNLYDYTLADPINNIDLSGVSAQGALNTLIDLYHWATGQLPPLSAADPSSAADLARTPVAAQIRRQFAQGGCRNGTYWGDFQYGELATTSNLTGQAVGSFGERVRNIGNGQIVVTAFNTWGLESATRFPGTSNRHNASVEDMIFSGTPLQYPRSLLNNRTSGPMRTATVNYSWIERSPCGCPNP